MKRWHHLITREWRAKLLSLALATLLWLFIHHSINYLPGLRLPLLPPPGPALAPDTHE